MPSRNVSPAMKRRPGRPLAEIPQLRETPAAYAELLEQRAAAAPEPEPKRKPGRPRKSLLTVDDLAAFLKISRTSLYGLIAAGCPYLRVGHVRRFDVDAVLHWLTRFTEHRQAADLE